MASTGFEQVAVTAPNYSRFDLSHDVKTSMRMGKLIPVCNIDTLPGDTFNFSFDAMFRLMPMVAPIMHKCNVSFHAFFVPNRILWPNWEKFITGGETASMVSNPPGAPYIELQQVKPSSLANYLGVPVFGDPTPVTGRPAFNALPFAAYQRIYKEWYRSQDLQPIADESLYELTDGLQDASRTAMLVELATRGWEHDYFTSCLPYAQKGDPVGLPIDLGELPVNWNLSAVTPQWKHAVTGASLSGRPATDHAGANTNGSVEFHDMNGGNPALVAYDPNPDGGSDSALMADASGFTVNTTINDLRSAWALQQWLEKNMRAGSRYREALYAHFGVRSSDARLQRPEYIGGARGTIAISEVLQTQATMDTVTPQGNMAGHGIGVMGSGNLNFRCEEHGWIIVLCSIMPTTAYYQGLPKMFNRFNRFDYAFPDFAQLGEQEVKNMEVFLNPDDGLDLETFGYLPRFAEYRTLPSRISGQMATTLDFWHMGRKFTTRPSLNGDFIKCVPTDEIFAVIDPALDNIVCHINCNISALRPLPVYGVPAPLV